MNYLLDSTTTWIISIISFVVLAVAVVFSLVFAFKSIKKKDAQDAKTIDYDAWINALGGIENISQVSANSSRLTIIFKNKEKVDKNAINVLKPLSTMFMSTKLIIVITNAKYIADYINSKL